MPPLPDGLPAREVLETLRSMKAADRDWRAGRVFSLVYAAGVEAHELLEAAAALYLSENALNLDVFPSLRQMQRELLDATTALVGGDAEAAGFLTSGGTESLLMAVKVARDWGRAERRIDAPEMVLPTSAHAAFDKAAHYFGVRPVRVPVAGDWRADPAAMEAAITDDTVLLVASAPSYPQGVVDPVEEVAAMADERGILCHVDACMGGFMLPFLRELGRFDRPWDLAVPGVTSISADLHKYGYAPKGVSSVVYRSRELRRLQAFVFDGWLGGAYGSPAMQGTRPAAPIAGAWAVLRHLGWDGYLRLAEATVTAADALRAGIGRLGGLRVLGEPDMPVFAVAAAGRDLDVFGVADALAERGWYVDRQSPPDSLHFTVNPLHVEQVDAFLADLESCVVGTDGPGEATAYATLD